MSQAYYKQGSYGSKGFKKPRQNPVAAQQQIARQNYILASRGLAPLSNRGFGSMANVKNRERKYSDTGLEVYPCDAAGLVRAIFIPKLGSDFNQRIGRKTILKSVYIRGTAYISGWYRLMNTVALNQGMQSPPQMARMILLWDCQPNGAIPTLTDILDIPSSVSQLNPNNRDRFKILKDKCITFDATKAVTDATGYIEGARSFLNHSTAAIKIYKKLNLETIFGPTSTGNIGDINSGALLVAFTNSVSSTILPNNDDSIINMQLTFRMRFDDS